MTVHRFRIFGFALAGVLLIAATTGYAKRTISIRALASSLAESDVLDLDTGLLSEIKREPDPVKARIVAARSLLATEADPATFSEFSASARRERALAGVHNLRLARALASEALATRPGSWQAHLIVGASTFLELSRTGASQGPDARSSWDQPLTLAHELAPAQPEPLKFLGAAYISEWSRLGEEQRSAALPLLQRAFEDQATLDLLVGQWLRIAPSLATALSALPDTSRAWESVARYQLSRSDWERYCQALESADRSLLRELLADIELATERRRFGDIRGSRSTLLAVLGRTPVHGPFDSVLEQFLAELPAGPVPLGAVRRLRSWFAWSRDRCLQGDCTLSESSISRLAGLAEFEEPARIAEAALMAGDLPRAEIHERRSFEPRSENWAPYVLLKARLLGEQGLDTEAWATLSRLPPTWRGSSRHALAVRFLDRKDGDVIGPESLPRGTDQSHWTQEARAWEIEIPGRYPGQRLEIMLSPEAATGAPVQLLWNGRHAGYRPVVGPTQLQLDPPDWLDLNLLIVKPRAETRIRAARLRLGPAVRGG